MLDALITSKTRVRLLVKFFLNPTMKAYLRELASEFDESTNSVRLELNRLKEAGKSPKVINIAIAHKLLRQAYAVATNDTVYSKRGV